ncbi:NADPH-dependent FMN reductase [Ferruginibacter sp.]|uniref:NADPH-dependent FMN reductase n=1 Tax=Ferruginibacter sp. TaxID=1940288 RepID=UPI00265A33DB|nr:NAD(P)H-dependent oxidoreductase [Ferruginibacter sp.]
MSSIVILSSSVRNGRKSPQVARYTEAPQPASVIIPFLKECKFSNFEGRLTLKKIDGAPMLQFAEEIKKANGVSYVIPEYNGGYPAGLQNAANHFYTQWHSNPVVNATVSTGLFGITQVITSLQFTLWKIKSWTVPAMFSVPTADKTFDESGHAIEKEATEKRAAAFIPELMWCIEANKRMN